MVPDAPPGDQKIAVPTSAKVASPGADKSVRLESSLFAAVRRRQRAELLRIEDIR